MLQRYNFLPNSLPILTPLAGRLSNRRETWRSHKLRATRKGVDGGARKTQDLSTCGDTNCHTVSCHKPLAKLTNRALAILSETQWSAPRYPAFRRRPVRSSEGDVG